MKIKKRFRKIKRWGKKKIRRWVHAWHKNPKRVVKVIAARFVVLVFAVLFVAGLFFAIGLFSCKNKETKKNSTITTQKPARVTATPKITQKPKVTPKVTATPKPEKAVYTYLQGPKSWHKRLYWAGPWGDTYVDGGHFGGFGCGICCMSNIYSTQIKKEYPPLKMYHYVKTHTGYYGGSAISWGYMKRGLQSLGFTCKMGNKQRTYKKFQNAISKTKACVVLVSGSARKSYWKYTSGHYVTIFLYNKKTDKVFLADSGNPKHNRRWVSLKKIYYSLKMESDWQYLAVTGYHKKK